MEEELRSITDVFYSSETVMLLIKSFLINFNCLTRIVIPKHRPDCFDFFLFVIINSNLFCFS